MHRQVTSSLIVASAMLASGCGTLGGTVVIDEDGNSRVVYGRDFGANPAVEYPRAQAAAYAAMYANQRPLLLIEAREGQPIRIDAARIEVWAPQQGGPPRIAPYVSPWVTAAVKTVDVLGALAPWAFARKMLDDSYSVTKSVAGAMSAMSGDAVTAVGQGTVQVAQFGLHTAEVLGTEGYQQIGNTAADGFDATTQTAQQIGDAAAAGFAATTQTATAGFATAQFALGELGDAGIVEPSPIDFGPLPGP